MSNHHFDKGNNIKHTGIMAILSAIVFEKDLKKGETAYHAAFVKVNPNE